MRQFEKENQWSVCPDYLFGQLLIQIHIWQCGITNFQKNIYFTDILCFFV